MAAELDPAGVRALETGDEPEEGGLARAGRPEQGEELAFVHVEVDAVDGDHGTVVLADALQPQGRRSRALGGRSASALLGGLYRQSSEAITCLICVYSSSE